MIAAAHGNRELLAVPKTAFLCSRQVPAAAVLKCYDWAIAQRDAGRCVISGFHSQIERDVFHYLLAGTQPVIMALARGLKTRIEPELRAALAAGRLLIVTPFDSEVRRVTAETAAARNRLMLALADDVVVGYARAGGMLASLIEEITDKKIYRIVV
ncbi:hypothetical protein U27_05285 [Candidatus Vecturithrix granuli]|uniref:Smf/DprA SLOG domain-containing protein n=1 Tax=Vecturithrix granuli TaxID=1499967 RepID=A0A081C156_VECG1|nr:hypothetical protein U27_05285 [Candidatus Vecturithrix granuli]